MSNVEISAIWSQVIPGVFAIAGGVFSGLFVWLTSKQSLIQQRKTNLEQRRLERLEELYVFFEVWYKGLTNSYLIALRRHKGLITYQDEMNWIIENHKNPKGDVDKLMMIVHIHFQELKPHLSRVLEIRDACAEYLISKETKDSKKFVNFQKEFDVRCEEFRSAISDISKGMYR